MKSQTQGGIYEIRHDLSGRVYVGSAVSIPHRWREHKRSLNRNRHHSQKLQRAWNKYGAEAFSFSVIEEVDASENLLAREQHWLDATDAARTGFNMTPTAGSLLGHRFSDETKKRMSEAAKGHIKSPEHRAALSAVNTGKRMSDEARQKMREAKLGKRRGPHSAETRAKMAAAQLGKRPSEETRQKLAAAKRGKTLPLEVRAKMSASHKARLASLTA
jgi:group I intron endonuclease